MGRWDNKKKKKEEDWHIDDHGNVVDPEGRTLVGAILVFFKPDIVDIKYRGSRGEERIGDIGDIEVGVLMQEKNREQYLKAFEMAMESLTDSLGEYQIVRDENGKITSPPGLARVMSESEAQNIIRRLKGDEWKI
jgi:hypothetical protein